MSVGTESIKRASAKASGEIAEAAASENEVPAAEKKTAAKKTGSKSSSGTKKAAVKTSVIPDVTPEVVEEMGITGNEAYYLNDELPIYLL